ncbi:hypothetical protein ACEZDU_01445, partial [Yersinia pestis]|uniref:hypothetical protein n=1 Tax=Yersinia pestis TaxID=632 RepID=UPI0035A87E39
HNLPVSVVGVKISKTGNYTILFTVSLIVLTAQSRTLPLAIPAVITLSAIPQIASALALFVHPGHLLMSAPEDSLRGRFSTIRTILRYTSLNVAPCEKYRQMITV